MSLTRILYIYILVVFCAFANAQNVPFDKSFFPGKEKELEAIKKQMKKGDKLFTKGGVSYVHAIPYYKRAFK